MTDALQDKDIKGCCANFYQSDMVRMLLGDSFHPGGLALTEHLGKLLNLSKTDVVLDIACGRGSSAVHLASRFGCCVTGLDYGQENLAAAQAAARNKRVERLTSFRQGDAGKLPLDDGVFDAIISECSFCTFADKEKSAAEMARVLRPGGRLGITDITVNDSLPEDVKSLFTWVTCIAGADSSLHYVATLVKAGFTGFILEDQRHALLEMIKHIRQKLMGAELAVKFGAMHLGDINFNEARRLAGHVMELINQGAIGYLLITARKE